MNEDIESAISKYNLGKITSELNEISGDIDINYKIYLDNKPYLLKKIINVYNLPQFEILGDVHEYLISKNLPFPKIFKTKNGEYVENNFILYEFLDGEKKTEWTDEEIISLTSNFTCMIIALMEYPTPEFIKNKSDKYIKSYDLDSLYTTYKPLISELPINQNVKDSIIQTIDILHSKIKDFNSLPKYFIHGDVNESNTLFRNGKNVGIIDIGGSYDPIVYELAEFLYWFTLPNWSVNINKNRFELITKTFEKIKPLSALEKELIPYMMLRRGIMDVMLTLPFFRSKDKPIPEKRLGLLTSRNNKIIDELINKQQL